VTGEGPLDDIEVDLGLATDGVERSRHGAQRAGRRTAAQNVDIASCPAI
jgi:hypothetical protein